MLHSRLMGFLQQQDAEPKNGNDRRQALGIETRRSEIVTRAQAKDMSPPIAKRGTRRSGSPQMAPEPEEGFALRKGSSMILGSNQGGETGRDRVDSYSAFKKFEK